MADDRPDMERRAMIRVPATMLADLLQLPDRMRVVHVLVDRAATPPFGMAGDTLVLAVTHPDLHPVPNACVAPDLTPVYQSVRVPKLASIEGMPRWQPSPARWGP